MAKIKDNLLLAAGAVKEAAILAERNEIEPLYGLMILSGDVQTALDKAEICGPKATQ